MTGQEAVEQMAVDESRDTATARRASTNGKRSAPSRTAAATDLISDAQREHQIKTALAVIYGYATTLEAHWESLADADRRHGVVSIVRATDGLMRQIERLLQDARRDAAGRARQVELIDVAELVRVGAAGWSEMSDMPVVTDRSGNPLHAWAEAEGLHQVLSHLVDNAIKYSPDGGETSIRLTTAGSWVEIAVADRGIGFPLDVNIFAPFQQAEAKAEAKPASNGDADSDSNGDAGSDVHTDSEKMTGVGLGLHIARTVVEAMGGSLSARRNSHGGSTFVVRLRRSDQALGTS